MELVNTHCHCDYSGHGTGSIAEYADAAAAAGLTTLAFTEHFPLSAAFDPDEYLSMRPQMVNAYLAEIDEARARHPQIEFVTGTEMDYLGALEDRQLTEEALAPFRFRLLSVHFIDGWAFDDPDQKARWKEPGAPDAIWRRYGELWCEAASNASLPYDAMSHPDLAKKFGYYPSFSLERLYDEMAEAARAGRAAAAYCAGKQTAEGRTLDIRNGSLVGYTVPQHVRMDADFTGVDVFFRVRAICGVSRIAVRDESGAQIASFRREHMAPGEMENISLPRVLLEKAQGAVTVSVEEEQA